MTPDLWRCKRCLAIWQRRRPGESGSLFTLVSGVPGRCCDNVPDPRHMVDLNDLEPVDGHAEAQRLWDEDQAARATTAAKWAGRLEGLGLLRFPPRDPPPEE